MSKKNFIYTAALYLAVTLPFFTGCKDDDDPAIDPVVPSEYIYVLNSGNMGSIFEARNGRRLGDMGQDMIVYGSKIYISVYGESTIEVTDLEAKSINQIETEGPPRSFAVDQGKVYVTYYNGYVARIDTTTLTVESKVQVGRNPEQLAVANGKLYVANSGGLDFSSPLGYDRTVSVIDIASFTKTKDMDVVVNPVNVVSDHQGYVYLSSWGNYGDVPNTLQRIDSKTDGISVMEDVNGTFFAVLENTLYVVHAQYGQTAYFYAYDVVNKRLLSDNFIGETEIAEPFNISTDKASGEIYIATTDYTNDGDVYVFDRTEKFVTKFEVGLNPMKVVRVKK